MDVETFKKTLSDIGERFIYATVRGHWKYLYITTSQHLTYKKVEKRSGIFDN